jgi:GntR family transcriptional regulator
MKDNRPMPAADATSALPETTPSFSPLYQQIKTALLRSLQSGDWKPGEVIPSEIELAARFKVSQGTVRKAIDELALENHLVRRQGKGTFVATHAEEQTRYRFLRLTPDDTAQGPLHRRLLECKRMRPSAELARALELKPGEPAVLVRRLLLAGGDAVGVAADDTSALEPVVLDDIWLPGPLFKGLSAEKLSGWRGPMYGLFETAFGVRMVRAEERIRAVLPTADEAALLGVIAATPLLLVERLSFTYGNQPVEFRRGLYHTARFHYRNVLS